ncbi:outer membrane lipoprotein carrier protein LolA [Peribacillus simplex]|uniref:LolA family protein n=1 Tax=Peribacillus simplex TaxID=1478 RepID=UPI003670B063
MERKLKKALQRAANQYEFTENVNIKSVIKKKGKKQLKNLLKWNYAVASLFIMTVLSVGMWNIPTVKADINELVKKAFNLVISDNYSDMQDNLNKMPSSLAFVSVEVSSDGSKLTTYLSGEKEFEKYENGDYTVSDGKLVGQYDKEKNTFTIWKNNRSSQSFEEELFKGMDNSKIQKLGSDSFLGRTVDKYLIEGNTELWFDQETKLILREINVNGNQRVEDSKVIDFKINVEVNANFFEVKPPKGAKVIQMNNFY